MGFSTCAKFKGTIVSDGQWGRKGADLWEGLSYQWLYEANRVREGCQDRPQTLNVGLEGDHSLRENHPPSSSTGDPHDLKILLNHAISSYYKSFPLSDVSC